MATIYKITNTITGEIYIGCTTKTVNERFMEHKSRSKVDKYLTIKLYKSIRDYGFDNFVVEGLFECDNSEKELCEINTIFMYDSFNNGLNHTIGGKGIIGYEYNEIHRKKALKTLMSGSKYRKGKDYSEIYGEKSIKESEKRREGVKKSWNNITDEDRLKRSLAITKNYLLKSGFNVNDIIKIKELRTNGVPKKDIATMFPHLTMKNILAISAPNRWLNIKLIEC